MRQRFQKSYELGVSVSFASSGGQVVVRGIVGSYGFRVVWEIVRIMWKVVRVVMCKAQPQALKPVICIWTLWTRISIFLHIPVINTSTLSSIPTSIYTQYCHDDLRRIFAISGSRFQSFLQFFNRIKLYSLLVAQILLSVFFLHQ